MQRDDSELALARREDWIAIGLLALLVVIAFANVVFGGKSLIPSENLNPLDSRPEVRLRGPGFVPDEEWRRRDLLPYPNFRDITAAIMQSDPSREFLRRSLLRGEFPFWDPYLGGGEPSFASLTPAYAFPLSLIVVLLGNGSGLMNAYILLLIVTAGVLTYFFLRQHGLSWPAALAGAIAFSFSGAVVQMAPSSYGQPVPFFALPLIVTARLIDRPSAHRAAQLALAFAFVALATFPPVLLQIFGMSVVYLLVALLRKPGLRSGIAAWFAAGAAVSLTMVGFAYVPAVMWQNEMPQVSEHYAHAAEETLSIQRVGQMLSPTIMGGPLVYAHPAVGETAVHLYYSGIVALLLAGIGVFAAAPSAARAIKITAMICGPLALAKIFGVPPVQWIASVPFLRNIHYAAYFGMLVAFSAALLAALGVDALMRGRARAWNVIGSAGLMAIALIVLRALATRYGVPLRPQGWRWIADFNWLVVLGVLTAVFAWIGSRVQRRTLAVMLVIAVLAFEGVTNASYPRPRRWDIWAHPPRYIEVLMERNSGGRILPMPVFPANTESVFRQPTIDVILTASTRMYELYRAYFGPLNDVILRETHRIPPERVLDAANIEYLTITPLDPGHIAEASGRGYETIYADDWVHLMRRPSDSRYSFTSSYQVMRSPAEALAALPVLPRGSVLLEQKPSFTALPVSPTDVHPRLVNLALNEVAIIVETPRPGLLVCSESNMKGWTATIDRQPVPIMAANYAFRAVEVPPGVHAIRFVYHPPGLIAGVALTILGSFLCVAGLLVKSEIRDKR